MDEHRMGTGTGAGTKTRVVAEMTTDTRMGTGTGTWTGGRRAEEKRASARNRSRAGDVIRHFHSARVIIFADRGRRLRAPPAPFVRSGVCTRASHRGGNRLQGARRGEREPGRDRSRGRERRWERNGNGDENFNGDGDGGGAGTRTGADANGETQDGNGEGRGDGAGTETGTEVKPVDKHRKGTGTGAGAKRRSVAEMGTDKTMGTRTATRTGLGSAKKRQRSAGNRIRVIDAMWEMEDT